MRRRFQLRLRTIFLLIAGIGAVCAFICQWHKFAPAWGTVQVEFLGEGRELAELRWWTGRRATYRVKTDAQGRLEFVDPRY
jgi:hypothetical protein